MKEATIHGSTVQHTQCATIGVRQNCLATELGGDALETVSDFFESLLPGDAFKVGSLWIAVLPLPLRRDTPHGIQHSLGEYTRSRYLATLAQRNPRVTGWEGSP